MKILTTPKLGKKLDERKSQRKLFEQKISPMSLPILMLEQILMIVTYSATQLFPKYFAK